MRLRILFSLLLPALLATACGDDDPVSLLDPDPPPLTGDCTLRFTNEEVHAEIDALLAEVGSLEAAGTLDAQQASTLRDHLNGALAELDAGQLCPARERLLAFRKQLESFVSGGVLQDGQAGPMIDVVDRLLNDVPPRLLVDAAAVPVAASVPGINGGAPRPVARFVDADGHAVDFVANELYLMTDDDAARDAFLARWNGTVLETLDFSTIGVQDVPPLYLVRIDPGSADTDSLAARWSRSAGLHGDNRVSGDAALKLLAAALEETVDHGLKVGVNFLLETADFADRTTNDAGSAVGAPHTYTPDAFAWPYMNRGSPQDIGTAEAWRVLDAMGRLSNRVRIGIADAGFRPNEDFPDSWRIFPEGDLRVENPDPSNCGSSGPPSAACVWHGTHVALSAMGRADNAFGAAGPAGPVGELVMLQSPSADFFAIIDYIANSVPAALAGGPRILNISASVALPTEVCLAIIIGVPVCETLHAITGAFRSAGILVVAAAGNDGRDVDETQVFGFWPFEFVEEAELIIPCELTDVLCVGGLDWNATTKHGGSNWGSSTTDRNTVRMFGPFELWSVADPVAADESSATPDSRAGLIQGTSFAAPYVAGVAALTWAADPGLNANEVEETLLAAAHTGSSDSRVPRWVNALGAVQRAVGGNTPPWIRITTLADSATYPRGRVPVEFSASTEDLEDDDLTVTWTSDRDGELGTGMPLRRFDLSYGWHTITATVSDGTFTTTSREIQIAVYNEPPTLEVLEPESYAAFCPGEEITFRADGQDRNNWPTYELPESAFHWSSTTLGEMGTGRTVTGQFAAEGYHEVKVRATGEDVGSALKSVWVRILSCAGNTPPARPTITQPAADTSLVLDGFDDAAGMWYKDIELRGESLDAEDGALTGAGLVWTTNQIGLQPASLGTGSILNARLYAETCAGAEHTITLTATDSGDLARAAERRITIWTLC